MLVRKLEYIFIPAVRRSYRRGYRLIRLALSKTLPLVLAVAAGAILAQATLHNTPAKVITAILGAIVCAIIATRIELGIVAVMITTASIIYGDAIPKPITAGGQGFTLSELLILFMCVLVFARYLAERKQQPMTSPILFPLLLFLFSVPMSMAVAYAYHAQNAQGPFDFACSYNNARPLFSYMLFFVVALGIQTEKQLKLLIRVLIWIATIVSILMMIQYVLGTGGRSVFIGGQYSGNAAKGLSPEESDIARSLPPGLSLMILFLLFGVIDASYRGLREGWKSALTAALLGAGSIFSFARSYWVSSAFCIFVMWCLAGSTVKRRLAIIGVVVISLTVFGSLTAAKLAPGTAGEKFSTALRERFLSTFERETVRSTSIQNRLHENRVTWKKIKQDPILGIGVGNPVQHKRWTVSTGAQGFIPVYQIHNSYLELWLVYGILGLVSFVGLSVAFLIRSLLLFLRSRNITFKLIALSSFAYYIHHLIISISSMTILHHPPDIATTALIWGLVEVGWRFDGQLARTRLKPQLEAQAQNCNDIAGYNAIVVP